MLGPWATVAATALSAIAFSVAAGAAWHRQAKEMTGFYATVAVFLFIAANRQVAGLAGAVAADKALFLALLVPAAVPIIFLVAMAGRVRYGHTPTALILFWCVVIFLGLWNAYWQGVDGPFVSDWGTEWALRSSSARAILLLFVTLPGLVIGVMAWMRGRGLRAQDRRRVCWVGASVTVYYVAFTIDALAAPGIWLLVTRLVTAAAAAAVAWVYWHEDEAPSSAGARTTR